MQFVEQQPWIGAFNAWYTLGVDGISMPLIVLTAFISPFRAERAMARGLVASGEFIEVHVDTPLEVAEARDVKGLYKKARRGELRNFTGIDSPYEAPENPELRVNTVAHTPEEAADQVIARMRELGLIH